MSDTPRTDELIAKLDLEPEARLVFVIKQLVNHAKEMERLAISLTALPPHPDAPADPAAVRIEIAGLRECWNAVCAKLTEIHGDPFWGSKGATGAQSAVAYIQELADRGKPRDGTQVGLVTGKRLDR